MRVVPLNEIVAMQAGVALEAVGGTVTGITPYKTGTHEKYGPWSIQNITVTDGTNKVKVKVCNHPEVTAEWMNHRLYFIAGQGKKGGTVGLKTDLDTYKGTSTLIENINENGTMSGDPPVASSQQSLPPPPQSGASTPSQPPRRMNPPGDPLPGNDDPPDSAGASAQAAQVARPPVPSGPIDPRRAWAKADKLLLRLVRCRVRCEQARDRVVHILEGMGIHTSADHAEKIASWLSIEATRGGIIADIPDCDPPDSKKAE